MAADITQVELWWEWIAAHAFGLLLAIYLASAVCFIVLAIQSQFVFRRLARLERSNVRQARLLDKLAISIDEHLTARAQQDDCKPAVDAAAQINPEEPFRTSAAIAIRDELVALRSELASSDAAGFHEQDEEE